MLEKERKEALKDGISVCVLYFRNSIDSCTQQEYYSQFTFRPKINAISRVIARPSSVEELYKNERSNQVCSMIYDFYQSY